MLDALSWRDSRYTIPFITLANNDCLYSLSCVVFQAATHLTEETVGADWTAPVMIVSAVGSAAVVGWAYLLVLTFCIQVSPPNCFGATGVTAGFVRLEPFSTT
jgi:hypothetical protein